MRNKNRFISTSRKAMNVKPAKVQIYNKAPPSFKSFDTLTISSSDHVTDKKTFYFYLRENYETKKLDKVVSSNAGLLSTKSHNLLITWSHKSHITMKSVINSFSCNLWLSNLAEEWVILGVTCLTTKSHIPLTMRLREIT